jgi:NitT/TauT family transport system permease protein
MTTREDVNPAAISSTPRAINAPKANSVFVETYLPPIIGFVMFIALWQLGVTISGVKPFLVPGPWNVVNAFIENGPNLLDSALTSLQEAVVGFLIAAVMGALIAFILASNKLIERTFYPYAVMLQATPIIAIAPIITIWFDVGFRSIVIITVIVSIFPIIANTTQGLISVEHNLVNLFKLYGSRPTTTLLKLRLPYALPYLITGLRIAAGLTIIGTIVGEYMAGMGGGHGGLGFTIAESARHFQTSYLFAAALTAALLGVSFFLLVNLLGWLLLRNWHESAIKFEN